MLLILKLTKIKTKNCEMNEILVLKNSKVARRINAGHPWVFSNELVELPDLESGSIVKIVDKSNFNYGLGFYNKNSLIAVRLLFANEVNYQFIKSRIRSAFAIREKIIDNFYFCRIVFGESDYLPGLVIDRYGEYFVFEIFSTGIEKIKELVIKAILELTPNTKGILQKNSSIWRQREGLSQSDEILFGDIPDKVLMEENGIKYEINIIEGQKTGYFYDQRLNRLFVQKIARNSRVLDLFCNQGGFALNAAKGGASTIVGVDVQSNVIDRAKKNVVINNLKNIDFIESDCFDFLKNNIEKFNIIISDPPAFTKSKKNIPEAVRAYHRINKLAIRNLENGGILLSSSCSHHIFEDKFYEIIQRAAIETNRKLRLIYRGLQSPDHPILDALSETKYLKFFGFIVD